jgi:hypothetical protein
MPPSNAVALRRAGSALASIGAATGAALVPKCPLCVAAILSAAGFGTAGAHHLAPFIRGAALALAVLLPIAIVLGERRRARRPCCAKSAALR